MATKKLYIGSNGPYLYNDASPINDPDGDFAGEDVKAIVTDGQLYVSEAPVLPQHIMRKQDMTDEGYVTGPLASTDNAIARWHGVGGDALQDSLVTVDDDGNLDNPANKRVGYGILGDAGGRFFRSFYLYIQDGTNPNTLKCTTVSQYNGHTLAVVDNIAKGATTGTYWTLNASGTRLTIELGNVVKCTAKIRGGTAGHYCLEAVVDNDIAIDLRTDITSLDLTTLVDVNDFVLLVDYITSS